MDEKGGLEQALSAARLARQRIHVGATKIESDSERQQQDARLAADIESLRTRLVALDARISPLAAAATQLVSKRWGLIMRAGVDKSHLARQIERYADVYTSRVSNFLYHTPFVYLRAPRMGLPHDATVGTEPAIS